MDQPPSIAHLADGLRQIYRSDPDGAPSAIDTFLAQQLADLSENGKKTVLASLTERFIPSPRNEAVPETDMEEEVFTRIFSLLLGREISTENLSSRELMERLSNSLQTIFAALNRLIQNINTTLLGGTPGDQTIRQVIGMQMEGEGEHTSLEAYLGRIDKAFFVSHQAFRQAAHTTVLKILRELDPEKIASETGQGLRFGPLKKAEYFDTYAAKYLKIKTWFESGRFMEDLLREFENNCQMSR